MILMLRVNLNPSVSQEALDRGCTGRLHAPGALPEGVGF